MINREFAAVKNACVTERTELLEQHQKSWDTMMAERRQKEVDYMAAREQRVEEFEQQLQEMRIQDAEEYNQVKIKLETDVQVMYFHRYLQTVAWKIACEWLD